MSQTIDAGGSRLRPWGLDRMTAFPHPIQVGHARVELDPDTQTGRYFDPSGQPIEAGRHGTGTDTSPATGTNLDGRQDSDTGQDGDQD